MLGASDDIPVNVTVKNIGESAYETQLFIKHPATVPYNRIETRVCVQPIMRIKTHRGAENKIYPIYGCI